MGNGRLANETEREDWNYNNNSGSSNILHSDFNVRSKILFSVVNRGNGKYSVIDNSCINLVGEKRGMNNERRRHFCKFAGIH